MCFVVFFFFKQKTAYEMRISDWSSDVCSSDLDERGQGAVLTIIRTVEATASTNADMLALAASGESEGLWLRAETQTAGKGRQGRDWVSQNGRASCRARVCQYV